MSLVGLQEMDPDLQKTILTLDALLNELMQLAVNLDKEAS